MSSDSVAASHIDYDYYLSVPDERELAWRKELLDSPNGGLITRNRFFSSLEQNEIWLAHITSNLKTIEQTGVLRLSAGSLVGTVYCVPAYRDGDAFTMHNLGNWIYFNEARATASLDQSSAVDMLLLKIQHSSHPIRPIGTDYTRLGRFHYECYTTLRNTLNLAEQQALEQRIVQQVASAHSFLLTAEQFEDTATEKACRQFIDSYAACARRLPILGYLYFEALVEYILCYQDDDQSKQYAKSGEFFGHYYKRVVQDIRSSLFQQFRLASFAPESNELLAVLARYSDNGLVFRSFDETHCLWFLARRLAYLIQSRCIDRGATPSDWQSSQLPAEYLPLVGHLINLGLRGMPRSLELYHQFGQLRAHRLWDYWNASDVIIPFNGLLPRGETGINPTNCTPTTCQLFKARLNDDGQSFLIDRTLEAIIAQELVDPKYTFMGYKKPTLAGKKVSS